MWNDAISVAGAAGFVGFLISCQLLTEHRDVVGLDHDPPLKNSRLGIRRLNSRFGLAARVRDPLADGNDARRDHGTTLTKHDTLQPADAVILAVDHEGYVSGGWRLIQRSLRDGTSLVLDVKSRLDHILKPTGVELWGL